MAQTVAESADRIGPYLLVTASGSGKRSSGHPIGTPRLALDRDTRQ
jgi:hypothetical protein